MGRLRIFLTLLLVDWLFGIPGLGVETRTGSDNPAMNYVYTVVGLALILALALTWFRPRYAGPLAMVVVAPGPMKLRTFRLVVAASCLRRYAILFPAGDQRRSLIGAVSTASW